MICYGYNYEFVLGRPSVLETFMESGYHVQSLIVQLWLIIGSFPPGPDRVWSVMSTWRCNYRILFFPATTCTDAKSGVRGDHRLIFKMNGAGVFHGIVS
jgi:hypothetical protein